METWKKIEAEDCFVMDKRGTPLTSYVSPSEEASGGAFVGSTANKEFIVENVPASNRVWLVYATHAEGYATVFLKENDRFRKAGVIQCPSTHSWGISEQCRLAYSTQLSIPEGATIKISPRLDIDVDYFLFSNDEIYSSQEYTLETLLTEKDIETLPPIRSIEQVNLPEEPDGLQNAIEVFHHYAIKGSTKPLYYKQDFKKLTFFTKGIGTYRIGDQSFPLDSCVVFTNKNQKHCIDATGSVVAEWYDIAFRLHNIADILPYEINTFNILQQDFFVLPLRKEECNNLLQCISLLNNAIHHNADMSINNLLEQKLLLSLILVKLNKIHEENKLTRKNTQEQYIVGVMEYILQNFDQKLVANDIAHHFHVSRSKLMYDFKQDTGLTLNEFIISTRMKFARNFLMAGETVNSTALKCGFPDVCYFIRVFKHYNGVTPHKFSQMNHGKNAAERSIRSDGKSS